MPAQWTGDVVKQIHINCISKKQLAEAAGINPKYLSAVLNSDEPSPKARAKVEAALDRLIPPPKLDPTDNM